MAAVSTADGKPAAKILVVDDTPSNVKVLRTLLAVRGYTVITAENGQDALDKAASEPPELILMDVVMPVMDGYEACRRLRALPATKDVPIVMVTASGPQEKAKALAVGANDMIMKPVDPAAVLALVATLLAGPQP
ncbi:MAG TPA: response regulator [Chloroflexota bacterium]